MVLPRPADVGAPSAEAPQSQRPALGPDGARAVASDLRRSGSEPGADHVMKGPMTVLHVLDHSVPRSEEHTSELQSQSNLVCRLLLEKKKKTINEADTAQSTLRSIPPCSMQTAHSPLTCCPTHTSQ